MKAVLATQNVVSDFIVSWWTPVFVGVFFGVVVYALWPRNKAMFDAASQLPLEE